jgi:hypothetical protein
MSIELMSAAWKANLPTGRKIVLLSLCDNANDQGECYPSIATISTRCGVGVRSVYRYIDEFEQVGAIWRENRVGRSTIYHIDASKFGAFLTPATPATVAPTPATVAPTPATVAPPVPATVAPITIIEPSSNQIPNTTRAQKNGAIASAIFVVDDVDSEIWADFVKLRKAKKSPLTKTAVDGIRREAERAGWSMQAVIAECCARGWSGFKADWVSDKSSPKSAVQNLTFAERDRIAGMQRWEESCNQRHPELPQEFSKLRSTADVIDITPANLRISQ